MRIIVEVFGRALMFTVQGAKVRSSDDECEDSSQEEEFDHVPVDPHSVGGGSFERRSDFEDAVGQHTFGFGLPLGGRLAPYPGDPCGSQE